MRVALSEIWNFADIIKNDERGWHFSLHAGQAEVNSLSRDTLQALRDDNDFNTELLPEIFTFREILWQPNVFIEAEMSLPSLRVLQAYCAEQAGEYEASGSELALVYASLLKVIGQEAQKAIERLEAEGSVKVILGELRRNTFPIIRFFIAHPRNRLDYYRDAVNRLNYAVKIIITEFSGKYSDLQEPYWEALNEKQMSSLKAGKEQVETPKAAVEKG